MCGIFAYLNFFTPKKRAEVIDILLQGLRRMEYRGYDSAGFFWEKMFLWSNTEMFSTQGKEPERLIIPKAWITKHPKSLEIPNCCFNKWWESFCRFGVRYFRLFGVTMFGVYALVFQDLGITRSYHARQPTPYYI